METGDDLRFDRGEQTPPRLRGQLSRLVGMTAVQLRRVANEALGDVGARKDHFVVLATLAEFGPASQSTLSTWTRIYSSDLVSVLNDLASAGFVERSPDPVDKRRNVITVTDDGHARLDELGRVLDGVNEHVMAPLDAGERAQLFALLERINARLNEPEQ
ncbi:MarR family transcriptional regulator [Saccharomonospora sp. CUA-673]|uniref:MarR family winged helix-turn-helix transcriptional regulator n=1 Tax=Saccharomonospora sp. CUA-673 TaxID=1904969 RepID=UPI00095B4FAE|nr:MarR family winged helix-turn-helix transcriptional regulator [Saccharomonospora sp. CUA-673]OLT42423.1 MarR family transcriptional regulator [Saccharomonospora sp. CUA-673]